MVTEQNLRTAVHNLLNVNPFKVSKFKNSNDFFFWSIVLEFVLILIAGVIGSTLMVTDQAIAQKMLELTITLDGVLFGFSAVMIGFYFRGSSTISESRLKLSLWWALMAFWSYIMSILISFMTMAWLNRQTFVFSVFTPIWLTILGSIFTSIYLILLFIEEIFPEQDEKAASAN